MTKEGWRRAGMPPNIISMERTIATSIYVRKRRTSRHKRKMHRWTLLLVAAALALFATTLYFVNIWLNPTVR